MLHTRRVNHEPSLRSVPSDPEVDAARRLERPDLSQLGLNRVGIFLAVLDLLLLLTDALLYVILGIHIEWSTAVIGGTALLLLLGAWLSMCATPGGPTDWFIAELVFVMLLMVFLTNVASLFQYGAVAVGFPYVDPWLAAADAALGINVQSLAGWTASHPAVATCFKLAYFSFLPQMFLVIAILAVRRDRERLWEFTFHFHTCLILCVAALILAPAVCPPAYYGFTPTIDMTVLIGHIRGLHDGTMRSVRFDELEGLVSLPSFHVAGALIVLWAVRGRRRWFLPLAVLNVILIASTFVTGVHYVIDVLAAIPLFLASVFIYNRYCRPWIIRRTHVFQRASAGGGGRASWML